MAFLKSTPRRRSRVPSQSKAEASSSPVMAMPSPSVLAEMLAVLWSRHETLDAGGARSGPEDRAGFAIAASQCLEQIRALEALLAASAPTTAADAVAMLVVIRSKFDGLSYEADDETRTAMQSLLAAMMPALTVLARSAGFNLATMAGGYLSLDDTIITRGGVPA